MNKIKISKLIISIIMFVLIISISTKVFADAPINLGSQLGAESFDDDFSNPSAGDEDSEEPEDSEDPEGLIPSGNNTPAPENNPNTSIYEESNIPYTGPVEDTLMIVAFIIFGVIGVYTFKKLSDYSNI